MSVTGMNMSESTSPDMRCDEFVDCHKQRCEEARVLDENEVSQ